MNNIHGNVDLLQRSGSGYSPRTARDFLNANDTWSQMRTSAMAPTAGDCYDKPATQQP
jgi:hypothetical protein